MAKILVVEDYEDLAGLIKGRLESENDTVAAVGDGVEAARLLDSTSFDLIILDWNLPGMSGLEVCRRYRAGGGSAPILMLTSRNTVDEKEAGLDAGADDYLVKPFHPRELMARVRAMLRRSDSGGQGFFTQGPGWLVGKTLIDRYEMVELIGEGNMGVVYKAIHLALKRTVAVKIILPQLVSESKSMERFRREAQSAGSLSHANIVTIYDFGVAWNKIPYLVMDYIDGQRLSDRLDAVGYLKIEAALPIFSRIADALRHAHEHGVLHRDIKPSNIILYAGEEGGESLKIVDFGIAKLLNADKSQELTATGEICGSPLFMSPEQVSAGQLDMRSDIYSFGCLMHYTLTGQAAFESETIIETMWMRLAEDPRPVRAVCPQAEIPEAMETIVLKCLARRRADRYQSMGELLQALEAVR